MCEIVCRGRDDFLANVETGERGFVITDILWCESDFRVWSENASPPKKLIRIVGSKSLWRRATGKDSVELLNRFAFF